jgi:hypothetical protein
MAVKSPSHYPSRVPRILALLAGHGIILSKTVDFMLANPGNPLAQGLIWFTGNSAIGLAAGYYALHFADMPTGTNGAKWFPFAESLCRFNFTLTLIFLLYGLHVWSNLTH